MISRHTGTTIQPKTCVHKRVWGFIISLSSHQLVHWRHTRSLTSCSCTIIFIENERRKTLRISNIKCVLMYCNCFSVWPSNNGVGGSLFLSPFIFGNNTTHNRLSRSLWRTTSHIRFNQDSHSHAIRKGFVVVISLSWNSALPESRSMQWKGANEQLLVGWGFPVECTHFTGSRVW